MENVKYIVLGGIISRDEEDGWEPFPPVLCEDADKVSEAIDEIIDKSGDWSVWEMVDGKPQRRSCVWSPVFEIQP